MFRSAPLLPLFLLPILVFSQNIELNFIDSIPIQCDIYFGRDIFGYDYFSQKNVLYKQKKAEKKEYKNLFLGKIHHVDFINPLKTLLFYKDFNSVILLDNQLSEITSINFSDFDIIAQNCSVASQNRFWVYDMLSNSLVLFDYVNNKKTELNQVFKNTFKYCTSDYNQWMMISENNQLFSYNNYGKMFFWGIIPEFDRIAIVNSNAVIFELNNNLYFYQIDNKNTKLLFSDKKNIQNLVYQNNTICIFTRETIENYTLKLP